MATPEDRVEDRILLSIDGLRKDFGVLRKEVSDSNTEHARHIGESDGYRKKTEHLYKTMYGNGSIGVRAQIVIVWGLLALSGTSIISLTIAWVCRG